MGQLLNAQGGRRRCRGAIAEWFLKRSCGVCRVVVSSRTLRLLNTETGQSENGRSKHGRRFKRRQSAPRMPREFHDFATAKHHLHRFNAISGGSVTREVATRCIHRKHTANGRHAARGRIGTKQQIVVVDRSIQVRLHHARLHANCATARWVNSSHISGEVNDQASSQRLSGQAAAAAARIHGQFVLVTIFQQLRHVASRTRPSYPQRLDLIDAGIAGIELRVKRIAMHVPFDEAPQVGLNVNLFWVHIDLF